MPPIHSPAKRLSARAVYASNTSQEGEIKKGRGRPRKYPVPSNTASVKGKSLANKHQRSTGSNREVNVQNNSSEADCSSEGEEEDSEDSVEQESDDSEVSDNRKNKVSVNAASEVATNEDDELTEEVNDSVEGSSEEHEEGYTVNESDEENVRYSLAKPLEISSPTPKKSSLKKTLDSSSKSHSKKIFDYSAKTGKLESKQNELFENRAGSSKYIEKETNDKIPQSPVRFKMISLDDVSDDLEDEPPTTVSRKIKMGINQVSQKASGSKRKAVDYQNSDDSYQPSSSLQRPSCFKTKAVNSKICDDSYQPSSSANNSRKKKKMGSSAGQINGSSSILDTDRNFQLYQQETHKLLNNSISVDTPLKSMSSFIKVNKTTSCGNVVAEEAFRWLIHPMLPDAFFRDIFEKKPHHLIRFQKRRYYYEVFNGNDLHTMLKENLLQYDVDIDVLKYVHTKRIPVEAAGRAYSSNVWDDYKQGYSIRVRNPQTFNKKLWNICSLLEEYFSSTVGVNAYLTPPGAQGFPPHYDDIDAFIAQVEGQKHWKVYAPRSAREELARYSSIDFNQEEIGAPILEVTLRAGEMLYIPRGYIHQASTTSKHSLHLTFSANQLNTWGDMLIGAVNRALEKAILNDVDFRKSIPRDYMDHSGLAAQDEFYSERHSLRNNMRQLATKALCYLDIDEAADIHALRFIRAALPPTFSKLEKQRSIHGNGTQWKDGKILINEKLMLDTEVRFIRKRNLRLIADETGTRLYHNLENNKDGKSLESDNQETAVYVDFPENGLPAYTCLMKKYPNFMKIENLPFHDNTDKLSFANSLYENGVLITKDPLSLMEEDIGLDFGEDDGLVREEDEFFIF